MQIQSIFKKNISRPINGVVKADQLDESVVWQELDEYVLTRELDNHFRAFMAAYLAAIDHPNDPVIASRMAVWISGFFGSGKSHFLKILSYLLGNKAARCPDTGNEKRAVEFFTEKIQDPMLLADIKRTESFSADVILFNIDSRADASDDRAAILSVFWRLFNENLGFCSDSLPLAEIERYLTKKGQYEAFKSTFNEIYGSAWEEERDAYTLLQDEIVEALSIVLDKKPDATREWFEKNEESFTQTVENFAKQVKEYLDTQPRNHRVIFLVDEIGQFIGGDTHLMLNLQTIVEDLGRLCGGRAWVMVTSQEDIDSILGDIKSSKANDFSKIQGRFNTRLSLSSTNTDEVIQARLLEKHDSAASELESLFAEKGDILKSQLSFTHDTTTLNNFSTKQDFVNNYPFIPYHFQLVQKIFESIRKAGATGLHLSKGERSMLDAFQSAAISVSPKKITSLVPLYEFFPCIESFLDTSVKRSIEQAKTNKGLQPPFDIQILQTLFLIRYVDIIKPNVDNLVTLSIDQVDADRITLKQNIDETLLRLEKENLISRNGNLYFFLTNEEREVSREIKSIQISSHAETDLLANIIFEDILKGKTKHKYLPFKRDYAFNRICDEKPWGKKMEYDLTLEIISPMHDEYSVFNSGKCSMHSADTDGTVLIKLDNDQALFSDIRTYIQTDKYIKDKSDAAASTSLKQILRDRADENRDRKERLTFKVDDLIKDAEFYTLGKPYPSQTSGASTKVIDGVFDHLIQNIFNKYDYLSTVHDDPIKEIRQILLSDHIAQEELIGFAQKDYQDVKELKTYIELKTATNKAIVLDELVKHFARRPYGWPEFQVVVLIAKIFMAGSINLLQDKNKISPKDAIPLLTKTPQWKNVQIIEKPILSSADIKKAQILGKELFGNLAPDGQDKISEYIKTGLTAWRLPLTTYKTLADTGNYPGKKKIDDCLKSLNTILDIHDSFEVIKSFIKSKDGLWDAQEDFQNLQDFYTHQKETWERLLEALTRFKPNRSAIEKDLDAKKAFKELCSIAASPSPYQMLKNVSSLISIVDKVNTEQVDGHQKEVIDEIDYKIKRVMELLNENNADDDFSNRILFPLQNTKKKIAGELSIPQIAYSVREVQELYETALISIEEKFIKEDNLPQSPPKEIKTIKVAKFNKKAHLDSEDDVNLFIEAVRSELLKAIQGNYKIRVQ
ncbi:MAG: BREX system P-loop protein BrxC [Desulfamplus sp.]|nr:BREX system P-loop protein BrxC [Desulfamplus sp.]